MPVAGPARRPDFASNIYAPIREALHQALNINDEQAIARLGEAWDTEQDQLPHKAIQPAPDADQGIPEPQPAEQQPEALEPKGKAKMSKFAKVPLLDSLPVNTNHDCNMKVMVTKSVTYH
ncbi:hypothetical protein JVU11DRAFT_11469 [Chiua virens]|nr:hypothetical protein JVU11DRAFT_11469 [Chiua virens]